VQKGALSLHKKKSRSQSTRKEKKKEKDKKKKKRGEKIEDNYFVLQSKGGGWPGGVLL